MNAQRPAFFLDVPEEGLARVLEGLERRRFPIGAIVVGPGESIDGLYVVESGSAEVFSFDRHNAEHHVGFIHEGETIGEMALLTGMHGGAVVRARTDLDVLVLRKGEFDRLTKRFPQLHRNLGAILAERLARTDRLAAEERPGRLFLLRDEGAPSRLGYALACSVAWHARAPTILVVLDDDIAPELEAYAGASRTAIADALAEPPGARASVLLSARVDGLSADGIAEVTEELFHHYEYVFVQTRGEPPTLATARTITLVGETDGIPPSGDLVLAAGRPSRARLGPDQGGMVRIPDLDEADRGGLEQGLLPIETAAGRALGWVARDLAGLKVGVAFGAGSVRGFAHLGVLKVLERQGVPIDYIAGTSVGAIVAGTYAIGMTPDEITDALANGPAYRFGVPVKSLLSIRALEAYIHRLGEGRRFEDTDIPVAIVAADLVTQKEVVFRRGELAAAVVASISIPGIYPAQRIGPYTLVDGGVLNPVPASVVAEMGAGRVVAIKLAMAPADHDHDAEASVDKGPRPSAVVVMLHAIEMMQSRIMVEARATTVTVSPTFTSVQAKLRHFGEGRRFVEVGEQAAEEALPRLATALPWLAS